MGRKLTDANRLSLRNREVAAQWHPTKNCGLTPHDVTYASSTKRWWICDKGKDHEWHETPGARASGKGCPFCAGKRVADSNRLSTNFPELVPEWHSTRNADLTVDEITLGSNRKVWWTCGKGKDHEWDASPNDRTSGRGCPFCAGKRVADSNRLSTNLPHLVPEWHPSRNGNLTADAITMVSGKRVWWLCGHGHEWEATVASRTRMKSGCPYCAGKRVTDGNRLSVLFPELVEEWHPTKNGKLTPADVSYGSGKKCWWVCGEGHQWSTVVSYRTLDGTGCPYCAGKRVSDANRLSTQYPDVAEEWDSSRNGDTTPDSMHYSSNRKFWWVCSLDSAHQWEATPNHRTAGRGCPFCSGRRIADSNRLSRIHPELVPEWHMTRNEELTPDHVTSGSNRKVWWRCAQGHEWDAIVASRAAGGHSCPYCSGLRVSDANRLSVLRPEMVGEWHPIRNEGLTPDDVAVASNRKVWWRCGEGHEWEAVIPSRTLNGNGCPYCAGQRVSDANRLSIRNPELIPEWHPTKNRGLKPCDVSYGTDKKVWWLCERGHEWDAVVVSRALVGAGCPYCSGHLVTGDNRLSMIAPELVKEWHPTRNEDLKPCDVSYGSARRVWWICERGHEWKAAIHSRSDGNGCRRCSLPDRSKVEVYLACELAAFFEDIDPSRTHTIKTPEGISMEVDILIRSQNLVVEYDGVYWHKGKLATDRRKTEMLKAAGWSVLRIRETPLALFQSGDLQCPVTSSNSGNDLKALASRVLIHLKHVLGIEIVGIEKYLVSRSLVNKAAADQIMGDELARRQRRASILPDPALQSHLL